MRRTVLALSLPAPFLILGSLILAACSSPEQSPSENAETTTTDTKAAEARDTDEKPDRRNEKPPLGAETEAEALTIREAANKAAALVEADAAQELTASRAKTEKPEPAE